MRPGKLRSVHPLPTGGFVALDVNGCLWIKQALHWDWERLETPHEQSERKNPRANSVRRNAK